MNIAHIQPQSDIYGPGTRYVIWTQGCSIRCPGCWNKEMWSFEPRQLISVAELVSDVAQHREEIEGVTILGGEPLDQLKEVSELITAVKSMDLSVMLYTGYELSELQGTSAELLLSHCDIVVTGRYRDEQRSTSLLWRGSLNQELHCFSSLYDSSAFDPAGMKIEIHLDQEGVVTVLGYPDDELVTLVSEISSVQR